EPGLRVFGIEHITGMVIAVAILHLAKPRKSPTRRRVLITTILPFIIMLLSIPWPARAVGRPLFRTGGATAGAPAICPPTFAARCASCHGARGAGDGPAASSLKPPPRNFADAAWSRTHTDADIAAVIHDG